MSEQSKPRCPKCGGEQITWEWLSHGCVFEIYCPCGFNLDSNRIKSLDDFVQFFSIATHLVEEAQ